MSPAVIAAAPGLNGDVTADPKRPRPRFSKVVSSPFALATAMSRSPSPSMSANTIAVGAPPPVGIAVERLKRRPAARSTVTLESPGWSRRCQHARRQ